MEIIKSLVHDLSIAGFSPGLIIMLFVIIFFIRYPSALDTIFKKKKNKNIENNNENGNNGGNGSNGGNGKVKLSTSELNELVKRDDCRNAMISVTDSIDGCRMEIRDGFGKVHARIDNIYENMARK